MGRPEYEARFTTSLYIASLSNLNSVTSCVGGGALREVYTKLRMNLAADKTM